MKRLVVLHVFLLLGLVASPAAATGPFPDAASRSAALAGSLDGRRSDSARAPEFVRASEIPCSVAYNSFVNRNTIQPSLRRAAIAQCLEIRREREILAKRGPASR